MNELLKSLTHLLKELTAGRVVLLIVSLSVIIACWSVYEHREEVVHHLINGNTIPLSRDFVIPPPSSTGIAILQKLMDQHPEIELVSLIDADPLINQRRLVYRIVRSPEIRIRLEANKAEGAVFPLYNTDPANNKQVIAVMQSELYCTSESEGLFAQRYTDVGNQLKYICRIPFPPSFSKSLGWIAVHLSSIPTDMDRLKFDALQTSLAYYNAEIDDARFTINP